MNIPIKGRNEWKKEEWISYSDMARAYICHLEAWYQVDQAIEEMMNRED
jgi:hypothetical protein